MKIIKRIIIVLLLLCITLGILGILALNRIKTEITKDDLPTEVYDTEHDLIALMGYKLIMFYQDEGEDKSLIVDFFNLLILDTIIKNINSDYDPLNGSSDASKSILTNEQFKIDFIVASLNDDDQLVISISLKRDSFPKLTTAFNFVFDIQLDDIVLNLTLDKVFLHDVEVKRYIYNYFISLTDKSAVEDYIEHGTLNLSEYTYTINIVEFGMP